MVCAQTEQPKDSIKRQRETVPEIRQELHINDRNIQTDGTLPDNTRQAAAGDSMTFRIPTFLPTVISLLSAIITLISA